MTGSTATQAPRLQQAPDRADARFEMGEHSPCIGVCVLDPTFASCQGCGRTGDEIAAWVDMAPSAREQTWERITDRLALTAREKATLRLMPWSPGGILEWAEDGLRTRSAGAWILPVGDKSISFQTNHATPDAIETHLTAGVLTAVGRGTTLRLTAHEKLRAFALGDPRSPDAFFLTLPRGRVTIAATGAGEALGPDTSAIRDVDRDAHLVSLAETADGVRIARRNDHRGTIIVETDCLRIETTGSPSSQSDAIARPALPSWAAVMGIFRANADAI